MSTSKDLDQFFTKKDTAEDIFTDVEDIIMTLHDDVHFVEPSAGSGTWIDVVQDHGYNIVAYDIDSKRDDIIQCDYLQEVIPYDKNRVIIGNPPFGKRSKLALQFLNKGLTEADTVCFIVPVQFIKYLTQKNVDIDAQLVYSKFLPENVFTFDDKDYSVRTVFQIWTKVDNDYDNLRITTKPPVTHPDFIMKQYNCTKSAKKFLYEDWDLAVLRQGWGDMTPLDPGTPLDEKKQWMLFHAKDPQVLDNIRNIDFNELGKKNTSVRGFGKADVVEEYNRLYG